MKNPITTRMFQQTFDFLVHDYQFKRKGKLYIRLVNDEVIQTVSLFISNPLNVDINIGLFSVYEEYIFLKEGNFRLSELLYGVPWEVNDPCTVLRDIKQAFIEKALPVFKKVASLDALIQYKVEELNQVSVFKGCYDEGVALELFETYLKLNRLAEAKKVLEIDEREQRKGLDIIRASISLHEGFYNEQAITDTQMYLEKIEQRKSALINDDKSYYDELIGRVKAKTKELLNSYGIIL